VDTVLFRRLYVLIIGALPRAADLVLPERHLGLHLPHEARTEYVDQLATLIETHIDLDALLRSSVMERLPATAAPPALPPKARLAVARDEAFCFYYTDNLELLEQAGAELVPFSPISDPLPENIDGIYIGGGYPELHADKLASNKTTRDAIREFASAGGPIYAECGGLMYLAHALELDGQAHPMCGVFPFSAAMPAPLAIAYVEITTNCGLFGSGQTARGHLFHHSAIADDPDTDRCYELKNSAVRSTPRPLRPATALRWPTRAAGCLRRSRSARSIHTTRSAKPSSASARPTTAIPASRASTSRSRSTSRGA